MWWQYLLSRFIIVIPGDNMWMSPTWAWHASKMVFATSLPMVTCLLLESGKSAIRFAPGAPRATVFTLTPFTPCSGKQSFEVFMKDKKVKTAVGFLSEAKTTEYMRDKPIGEKFLSLGGAGWIHPHETAALHKYSEGDQVKVEVDFDQSIVRFYINAKFTGEADWDSKQAFPAVSCDGGPCELEVTLHT